MGNHHSDELAGRVADSITSRTGQVWDSDARLRLGAWLDDPDHGRTAAQWLAYLAAHEDDGDPFEEYLLRRPLQDVLSEGRSAGGSGFVMRSGWWPWRRRRTPRLN